MDANLFLTMTMMTFSAFAIIMQVIHRAWTVISFAIVNAVVLIVGGVCLVYAPAWSAVAVAALFGPFVLAPSILSGLAQNRMNQGSHRAAARFAGWAALLHPSSHNRLLARLYAAHAIEDPIAGAEALEAMARTARPAQASMLSAMAMVKRQDWPAVLASLDAGADARLSNGVRLRALGETGRTDDMVRYYDATKPTLHGFDLYYAHLFVLAFTGRIDAAAQMLNSQLRGLPAETKRYWQAIATSRADDPARRTFEPLAELVRTAETPSVRQAAARHLNLAGHGAGQPPLSSEARAIVDAVASRVGDEARLAGSSWRSAPATLLLIAVLSAMFALQVWTGGAEDMRTLVRLGALWPPLVTQAGEWWRLLAAALLHAGWIHFLTNLFVLAIFARIVEATVGPLWLIAAFVIGAVASSGAVLAAMTSGLTTEGVLVGASGAIFALVGLETARIVAAWRRTRDELDRRRVVLLVIVMVLQTVIDLSVPEISLTAHLSGFVTGLLLGASRAAFSQR